MHWVAIARAAGFEMTWQDIDALSRVTPLLTRLCPNGEADVNDFNRFGGTAFLLRELLDAGHMHDDVDTVMGRGLSQYTQALTAETKKLTYTPAVATSEDLTVLRPFAARLVQRAGCAC